MIVDRAFIDREMETLRTEIKRAQEFLIKAEGALVAYKTILEHAEKQPKPEEPVFNEP